MFELGSQRPLFDVPAGFAYFNTAYNSPLLNASRDRLLAAASAKSLPWMRPASDFFDDAERVRELASAVLGGDADGYAIVPAASYGLSTAARALEPLLNPGDRILVMAEEFPSQVLPWRRAAAETGAVIETVPTPADGDWTAAVLASINEKTRVAALSPCHWTNGAALDLVAIGEACRAVSATLAIDGTQQLGAAPFDLKAIRPDFVVSAGYKWLLSSYGFSLMYVAEPWRGARPLEEVWLARLNAENFAGLVNYNDSYMPGARRFDGGEKCTAILPGAIAALEQLQAWGVDQVTESLAATNRLIRPRLEALGFQLPPPERSGPHMFGARLPEGFSGDLVGALRERRVYISQRGSALRFAPHLHVTSADIDQLFDALKAVLGG